MARPPGSRHVLLLLLVVAFVAGVSSTIPNQPAAGWPASWSTGGQFAFADDFVGNALDPAFWAPKGNPKSYQATHNGQYYGFPAEQTHEMYSQSQVSVSGGVCTIRAAPNPSPFTVTRNGHTYSVDYISGMITSYPTGSLGLGGDATKGFLLEVGKTELMIEFRAAYPGGDGAGGTQNSWAAVWLSGWNPVTRDDWVYELDIAEQTGAVGSVSSSKHYKLSGTGNCDSSETSSTWLTQPAAHTWHVFNAYIDKQGNLGVWMDGVYVSSPPSAGVKSPATNNAWVHVANALMVPVNHQNAVLGLLIQYGLDQTPAGWAGDIFQIDYIVAWQPSSDPKGTGILGGGVAAGTVLPSSGTGTNTYPPAVMATPGLQSYLRLGELGGAFVNSKTSHYPGIASASGVKRGVAGALSHDTNKAVKFDGLHGMISVPQVSAQIVNTHITLECWAVIYTQHGNGMIAGFHDAKHADFFIVQLSGTNDLLMRFRNSAGTAYSLTVSVPLGVWHHLVFQYDGAKIRAYVDGVWKASTTAAGHITTSTATLYMGSDSIGDHFSGAVDELALYSSSISAQEVLAHYHAGRSAATGTAVVHAVSTAGTKRGQTGDEIDLPSDVSDMNGDGVIDAQDFQLALARLTRSEEVCFEVAPLAAADEQGLQHIHTLLVDRPECPPSHAAATALMSMPASQWQPAGFNIVSQGLAETPATQSTGLSGGAIAGIVVACVSVPFAVAVLGFLVWRRVHTAPDAGSYRAFSAPM